MAANPVHDGGQTAPIRMSPFLRHISIMHLLSLGYEHCDARLWHLGRSLITSLASGNLVRYLLPEPLCLRCLAQSRRVRFTNRFTETVLSCPQPPSDHDYLSVTLVGPWLSHADRTSVDRGNHAIMAGMPGQSSSHQDSDERRRHAITAFLGAGMHDPPSPALAVQELAGARRSVAACCHARNQSVATWLAGEVRFPGIKENAVTLAVLEVHEHRQTAARFYAMRHPDRLAILQELLSALWG